MGFVWVLGGVDQWRARNGCAGNGSGRWVGRCWLERGGSGFCGAAGRARRRPPRKVSVRARTLLATERPQRVVVVGAGMAGMSSAITLLREYGWDPSRVRIVEASDAPGGRMRTDRHAGGFLLDRGFQVVVEAYPDQRQLLAGGVDDMAWQRLRLQPFMAGATVRIAPYPHVYVGDPLRSVPSDVLETLRAPFASVGDKARVGVARLRAGLLERGRADALLRPWPHSRAPSAASSAMEPTAAEWLQPFSREFTGAFFAPFYRGIFLDELSHISARMFRYIFHMFAVGAAALPDNGEGIAALPQQLARTLRDEFGVSIEYGKRVSALNSFGAQEAVILAVDAASAADLLDAYAATGGGQAATSPSIPAVVRELRDEAADGRGGERQRVSTCVYFAGDGDVPPAEAVARPRALIINADQNADNDRADAKVSRYRLNHICFPSAVARSYAPAGQYLVSCTVVETATPAPLDPLDGDLRPGGPLEQAVRLQLRRWLNDTRLVDSWRFLRAYRVRGAQPRQRLDNQPFVRPAESAALVPGKLYVCGDWCDTPTVNGAVASGRRAAAALAADTSA
ncbi:hypothetical protein CDCA_CDCA16G4190 [Cyanidium caldarium]|uniref:Amine oxidase domain-containing protein n=1 Tax=Cyanidium caldarium TaxID=2771 RepID=A0AAV9J1G9_CYACA|nr:hypothetical protein CDCA_CDCA16G4190 [Cyanidium caldarium]